MMSTWRVKTEADLPPREPDVRVSWEPHLGEPDKLRKHWCGFLAGEYDQPVGGVPREPNRPFGDVLADTGRQSLGLWVTFPKPPLDARGRLRYAEFKLQRCGEGDGAAVADSIRRELSLGAGVTRFAHGSVPVFAVGDEHVVKLFPPSQRSYFETERATLSRIDGLLPIPTPRAIAAGERGPWLYIVMTRLSGCSLAEAWDTIEIHDRIRLMREVGEALGALHAAATGELAPLMVDWPRFIDAQRASCRDRLLAGGLGPPWVDLVGDFLARWTPSDQGARVVLHTEVMREHLVVERRQGAWHISGFYDFEDAMLGAPEYELACAGIFLTGAEPGLLQALLDGYGATVDDELPLRIMAYALLHRYSNLRWYLERLPVPAEIGDLESLARSWFTITAGRPDPTQGERHGIGSD
jgi:hygromycin-B 7''-O-kinase